MFSSHNSRHRRLALLALCAGFVVTPARAENSTTPVDATPAAQRPSPRRVAVAAEGPDPYNAGRLKLTVRCPDGAAFAKSLVVTGASGARREASTYVTASPVGGAHTVSLSVAVTPADAGLRLVGAGVDESVDTPPMFFCRPGQSESPGMEAVFPLRLPFTQRLDPAQKPPRVTLTPAVSGVLTHIEGDAVVLTGAFAPRTDYTVRFESDVLGADGWIFKAGESVPVAIKGREASARFDFTEGVLSPRGGLGVPVKLCNLPKVTARVARLAPENLVAALHDDSVRKQLLETTAEKEVTFKTAPDTVNERLFDIRTSADKPGDSVCGVRLLSLEWKSASGYSDYEYERASDAFVTVTDLALTPMLDADGTGLTVWVAGLASGKSEAGVEVVVRSAQNRVVARGVTDASGLVKLAAPKGWVVTATKGDDFAYAKLDNAALAGSGDDHLAPATSAPTALLYADRGVHRGGETIRLTALARTATGAELPAATPMEFRLTRPDGKPFATRLAKPEAGGFYSADFSLPHDAPYGAYHATFAPPGAKEPIGTLTLPVGAFEPLRLRTELTASKTLLVAKLSGRELPLYAGAIPKFSLLSKYRFGSPASGLASSAAFRIEPAQADFKGFPGFVFGYTAEKEGRLVRSLAQPLDATGAREFEPAVTPAPGLWSLHADASVTEPGGRTDSADSRVLWSNATALAGLACGDRPPAVAQPFRLRIALANASGEPVAAGAPVKVVAERVIENWMLQREGASTLWRRTTEYAPAGEVAVAAASFKDGLAETEFTLAAPGEHRLTATTADGVRTVCTVFVNGVGEAAPGGAPHLLVLDPQKESAAPGETVSVAVQAPFAGDALLTLESDRVLESRVVRLTDKTNLLAVTLPKDARGSVWVALREIRALDAKQPSWKPVEAHGRAMIHVAHREKKLGVAVEAPVKALPGAKATVVVRVAGADGATAVHCWAVDTGILDISGYMTPNPFAQFLGPKDSAVKSVTTFDDLLPDFARTLERIGAGDGAGVFRGAGLKNRRKPALVWSGVANTDKDGLLRREVDLPEHTGELRWMAVAAKADTYGSGEAITRLERPVMFESSTPAFVAPGDTLRVPVALFNRTGAPVVVKLSTATRGVAVATPLPEAVTLPAGEPWRGVLTVTATDNAEPGPADITVTATGAFASGVVVEKLPLNIRVAAPFRTATRVVELKPGESAELAALKPDFAFAPGARMNLVVSDGVGAVTAPLLASLVDYPYGCLEQTSSRMIALAAAGTDDAWKARADALLRQGLGRLALNQRADGGLAYWAESGVSDPGGTLIAAEAIVASAARGVKADEAFVKSLAEYLRRRLYQPDTDATSQTRFCAALAGLGHEENNRMKYLAENAATLDTDAIASLALAFVRSGDTARARTLLESQDSRLTIDATLNRDGRYESSVVDAATLLDALDAATPGSPRAGALAGTLARFAAQPLNTREQGAVVGALVRHAKVSGAGVGPAAVTFDDGVAPLVTGAGLTRRDLDISKPLRLVNKGRGSAYIAATTTGVYVNAKSGVVENGLRVRRAYFDGVTGEPVDISRPLKVGAALRVVLSVSPTTADTTLPDIAVCDLLPACFETEGSAMKRVKKEGDSYYDDSLVRSELREDRAIAFVTARPGLDLEYRVRVVAAGRFTLPAPQASSMYRPDIEAIGAAGEVTVGE